MKSCPYPPASEHAYLWFCIQEDFVDDLNALLAPLFKDLYSAFVVADESRYDSLHRRRMQIEEDTFARRHRREEILHWLYFDSLLRSEHGIGYPDVYEAVTASKRVEP